MPATRPQKKYPPQHYLFEECEDHKNHLCFLVQNRKMDRVIELARDAKMICFVCGRAAQSGKYLCNPAKLEE